MREFINKLTDSIIILNKEHKIIFLNDAFLDQLGIEEKAVDLNEIRSQIKIKNNKITIVLNNKILREGIGEFQNIQWDGMEAKVVVVNWENNISNDLLDLDELEVFLDLSTDIILKADKTGIKDVGIRCFDLLGWTREEFMTLTISYLVHPEDLDNTLKLIKKQFETDESLQWENRVRCADGSGRWIRWKSRNLMNSKGYVYFIGKDITCDKVVEDHEKEVEKVKELEELRNEFFANISHEFKTPINMIMTTSQLMKQQLTKYGLDDKAANNIEKYINIYRQNGYRLLRLVNNLIDITKIDSGFYNIKPINVNIISVIEDIVMSVAQFCEGNKIQLTFDTEAEEEIISCDPDQVERIILNLISNAIKFTPPNGEIRVNIYIEDEYVAIFVQDTGRGIPKEKLEVIFERFVQCDETMTRTQEGSGIGLSLVQGLVNMHGGNIKVSSEEGVGSTFEVRLPRKQVSLTNSYNVSNLEIKQSKIEKCTIEFADIYNL